MLSFILGYFELPQGFTWSYHKKIDTSESKEVFLISSPKNVNQNHQSCPIMGWLLTGVFYRNSSHANARRGLLMITCSVSDIRKKCLFSFRSVYCPRMNLLSLNTIFALISQCVYRTCLGRALLSSF